MYLPVPFLAVLVLLSSLLHFSLPSWLSLLICLPLASCGPLLLSPQAQGGHNMDPQIHNNHQARNNMLQVHNILPVHKVPQVHSLMADMVVNLVAPIAYLHKRVQSIRYLHTLFQSHRTHRRSCKLSYACPCHGGTDSIPGHQME